MPENWIRKRWGWVLLYVLVIGAGFCAWSYYHDPVRRIPRLRTHLAEVALQEARESGNQELEIYSIRLRQPLTVHHELRTQPGGESDR